MAVSLEPSIAEPRVSSTGRRWKQRRLIWRYGPSVVVLAASIGLWQGLFELFHVQEVAFPTPAEVATAIGDNFSGLMSDTWITSKEVLLGLAVSIVSGVLLAIAVHLSSLVKRALYPLLIASQTVPSVVVAPLFVLTFGFGLLPKLGVIWLICFFPMVVNTVDGLRSVDTAYISMMRSLHASRWAIFRRVEFPAALPNIFTGARIAATYAAIGAVFGEWSGATGGLGYTIQQAAPTLQTPLVMAGVVLLSLMTLILFGLVSLAQKVFVPWTGER